MFTQENMKVIPLIKPGDYASAGANSAGVYVGGAHHVTMIISGAVQTDGNARVKVATGTGHATMTAHIKPKVYRTTAAAGAVAADTTAEVSYETGEDYWLIPITNDLSFIVEIPVSMVPAGSNWIRLEVGDQGAATNISAVAVVYPRYKPSGSLVRLA
jgi:hypothetical protein